MGADPISRSRLATFPRFLPLLRDAKVLDVGCASGDYLQHFGPGSVGLDLSAADMNACRARGLEVRAADLDDALPVDDGEFDVVFCSNVLEHVASPIHLLREARRALREGGGRIVLALPIEGSLSDLSRRNRYYEDHSGHLYAFTPRNIRRLLAAADFEVSSHHVEPWPAALLGRLGAFSMVDQLLQRLPLSISICLGDNYWTVARAMPRERPESRWSTDGDRMRGQVSALQGSG